MELALFFRNGRIWKMCFHLTKKDENVTESFKCEQEHQEKSIFMKLLAALPALRAV